MKHSTSRILITHTGSLPRPADLLDAIKSRENGKPVDPHIYAQLLKNAVERSVRKQAELGLDVIDDGEMGKVSFITYATERLEGFEASSEPPDNVWAGSKEMAAFPEFYQIPPPVPDAPKSEEAPPIPGRTRMECTGPITYKGREQLQRDLENLKAALQGVSAAEAFMPSICPSNVEQSNQNKFYKTQEEYLFALADAMHEEYKSIVDAGFLVQIDDPYLACYYMFNEKATVEDSRKWVEARVEALNHALRGIPEDRVRHHTCYGIDMGPRIHDIEMKHIADLILKIHAGAYSFEAANPRHEHEYHVWENVKLPEGKSIIPGVITNSSVLVEHRELVAERIVRFAKLVGKENVIAGADCGFAAFAYMPGAIHPNIVWAKLKSLAEGAELASKQLWS